MYISVGNFEENKPLKCRNFKEKDVEYFSFISVSGILRKNNPYSALIFWEKVLNILHLCLYQEFWDENRKNAGIFWEKLLNIDCWNLNLTVVLRNFRKKKG